MNEEKLLADSLETYIRDKHTQEECIGFIDGFKEALRQFAVIKSVCDCNAPMSDADDECCMLCGKFLYNED